MRDDSYLEDLRAEYRYSLSNTDLQARIRDLRAVMARRRTWRGRLIAALVVVGSFVVGVVLVLVLRSR